MGHYTPLASKEINGKMYTLMRTTCGALIGTNDFCRDHLLHHIYITSKVIFPNSTVDLLAVKSCSRPVNGQNTEKLNKVGINMHFATGFGGKGVTTSPAFGLDAAIETSKILLKGSL